MNRRDFTSTLLALWGSSPSLLNVSKFKGSQAAYGAPGSVAPANPTPPSLENQYRGYIVDHHSPDPPALTYQNFDPDQWFRLYEEADLDHVWVFCKGHHGEGAVNGPC